jgi:hypothetical protein
VAWLCQTLSFEKLLPGSDLGRDASEAIEHLAVDLSGELEFASEDDPLGTTNTPQIALHQQAVRCR